MHEALSPYTSLARVHLVTDAPVMDNSSTKLRELVGSGALIGNLVDPAVAAYIREHGLYRS